MAHQRVGVVPLGTRRFIMIIFIPFCQSSEQRVNQHLMRIVDWHSQDDEAVAQDTDRG